MTQGFPATAVGVVLVLLSTSLGCGAGDPAEGGGGAASDSNCGGLPPTCGSSADEDCCSSLLVSGDTYRRSYDGIDNLDESNPATVSGFEMDRFEVTVGRFRAFVESGNGTRTSPPSPGAAAHPLADGSGWDPAWNTELPADTSALQAALTCDNYPTWTDAPGANESLPINCVSWYEAFAFCAWEGGRLPTEAEWDYAAAGGVEQRYFPWSAAYPPGSTDIDASYAVYQCEADGAADCSFADIPSVGSRSPKGDGRWGHADLSGGMFEWAVDYHHFEYSNPCDDCINLTPGDSRIVRGGDFSAEWDTLRVARRRSSTPEDHRDFTGLRCVRLP